MNSCSEIYLDYNATHPLLPSVRAALTELIGEEGQAVLGNASSTHAAGRRSKKWVNTLKRELQSYLETPMGDWVLYSGATEALNAVLSTAQCEGWDVLASSVEHSAVYETVGCSEGRAPVLPVHQDGKQVGKIDVEGVSTLISEEASKKEIPILFAIQAHNNETGLCVADVQSVQELRSLAKAKGRNCYILLDCVQSLGKASPALLKSLIAEVDYAVCSGHKMGALMGVGALWKKQDRVMKSYPTGGAQERGLRAGTEAVWCVASWVQALQDWSEKGEEYRAHASRLKTRLLKGLQEIPEVEVLRGTELESTLSNTVALIAKGRGADFFLQKLDIEGVLVSGGSACRSGVSKASHVMHALGYEESLAKGLMRVSFGSMSTEDEIDTFLKALKEAK